MLKRTPAPASPLLSTPMVTAVSTSAFSMWVSISCAPFAVRPLKRSKGFESNVIGELGNDGTWYTGTLSLSGAYPSTNLAAVTYFSDNQQQIAIFFQATDLSLQEYRYNNGGWFAGQFISPVSRYHPSDSDLNFAKVTSNLAKPWLVSRSVRSAPPVGRFRCTPAIAMGIRSSGLSPHPGALPRQSLSSKLATSSTGPSGTI